MQKILIYKASAGSGKTFRLTLEYLKLLLSKDNAHRNILTVSFTNKATGEMKQRILGELYGIAYQCEKSEGTLNILATETGLSTEKIREKSEFALNMILHDYNFFNVETIDGFYQRVLRNMAKELGLGAYFNIELDNQKALKESVRSLIQSLSTEKESLQWICKIIEENAINEKYSKSIEDDLIATGMQIFDENFKRNQIRLEAFFRDKKTVNDYIRMLYSRRSIAKQNLKTIDDEDIQKQLQTEINSCNLVLNHLRKMGLQSDISRHLITFNHEQNRFLLADTSALLSQLIGENDTSFLYEKIGAKLHHILIDEFQDTSDMQWKNFKLLFLENLSKGYTNLIVGDVKQAIYRWRNSNWETLNTIEKEFYEGAVEIRTLNTNYRTDSTIVNFNNSFFQKAVAVLEARFFSEISSRRSDLTNMLNHAFQDVCQIPKCSEIKGFVELQFVKKEGLKSQQAQKIVEALLNLKEANVKPEDIMILVRNSSGITKISDAFENYLSKHPNLPEDTKAYFKLVSDEAFALSSSSAVCLIIDALQALTKPHNTLAFVQLAYTFQEQKNPNFYQTLPDFFRSYKLSKEQNKQPFSEFLPDSFCREYTILQNLPLYELVERIISIFNLFEFKNQHAFLYDFLDKVNVFVSQKSNCIADFVDYWTDELQKKNIAVNAQIPGVRILTIHKSKGLEFHTVIVPFCEWNMDEIRFDQLVWHESEPNKNEFEKMPLIPLNYGKTLRDSCFSTDFENETLKLWVDNLNLLYVALTRPKHNLLILAEALPKKSEIFRVSNLLYNCVNPLVEGFFRKGEPIQSMEKKEDIWDGNLFRLPLVNIEVPFSIATQLPTVYISEETRIWYQNMQYAGFSKNIALGGNDRQDDVSALQKKRKGLLYHRILAEVHDLKELDAILQRLVFDGFIPENEKNEVGNDLYNLLHDQKVKDWFSGKYQVYNECKIVNRNVEARLEHRRPDRVMRDQGGNLILVDFKTGKKHPQHQVQIQEYARLLKSMFADREDIEIRCFLWYLETNELETIEFIGHP